MKLDSESAPNAFFHPLGGHSDEWYSTKKFHDPKPTPKDRPSSYKVFLPIWKFDEKITFYFTALGVYQSPI